MKTSITVSGFDELFDKINVAEAKFDEFIIETVSDAAITTQSFAKDGIQRSVATGITYEKYKPRRTHKASAPGGYPASDTGRLANSIQLEGIGTKNTSVGTALVYGRWLEFGTQSESGEGNMLPRPWLQPSFELALKDVVKDAKKRFKRKFK